MNIWGHNLKTIWEQSRGTSKQAGGITFSDNDGNIVTDDDEDEIEEDTPIPVPNNNDVPTMENTEKAINDDSTTTGVHDEQQQENGTITGVHENETNETNDDDTSEHDPENIHDNVLTTPEEENNEADEYVTIEDINITSEMNASNREDNNTEDSNTEIRTNERYNLPPRPKNKVQFTLVQSDEQSMTLPKTHAHVMMTQLNIKDGLKAFGNKGDEAILKEIKQLHT